MSDGNVTHRPGDRGRASDQALDPGSDPELDARRAASLARGEAVAEATVTSGPGAGRRLLVWSAGQVYGDLGWPRLNQRVALFAEQLLVGAQERVEKPFDLPQGEVVVRVEIRRPPAPRS